ncbi:MAG: hypothetical protein LQ347_005714, partial [Umbilicaria vellea]
MTIMVTADGEEPPAVPNLRKQQSLPRIFTSARGRKVSKSTPSWPARQESLQPSPRSSQPPNPKLRPWTRPPSGHGEGTGDGGGQKQDEIGHAKLGGAVGGLGGMGAAWLPPRFKMNQLHLPKRGQSVTTADRRDFHRNRTLQDPTSPGLRVLSSTVTRQAPMIQPTQRSPTFPLVKDDSYDSLNMPFGFPSVPRARGASKPLKKPLPLPPQLESPRPYTAAPIGHDDQQTPLRFHFGRGEETRDQQEHSGNPPLPQIQDELEVRASLNSAVTTNSSYFGNSTTERSSIFTKSSSVSDLTIDHASSPAMKSEGMTVDEAIGMYAAGFTDDIVEPEDEVRSPPLPFNDNPQRSTRIAEAMSDTMGPDLVPPKPPFATEQRSSTAIMSGDALRSSSPRPPSVLPPTAARDCYGFHKATNYITVERYNEWNVPYMEVQNRRHKRWIALMREHRLSTDQPISFPERSPKTQRFIRKGIPPAWRGSA